MTFGLHAHRHPHWEPLSGFLRQVLVTASTLALILLLLAVLYAGVRVLQ